MISDRDRLLIRKARASDNAAVVRLVIDSLARYGVEADLDGHDKEVAEFGMHDDTIDEFVAVADEEPIGSVMVSPIDAERAWLSKFFVDERYRSRGIGRTLLAAAVDAARRRGYRRIDLDTRAVFVEAIHLYEATGWIASDDRGPSAVCDRAFTLSL
jgi:GNAT superfamily N-acetyltransferase